MAQHSVTCGDHHASNPVPLHASSRRIDRRTLLKATAAFIAASATIDSVPDPVPVIAEDAPAPDGPVTRAADWQQPDNVGSSGDYLSFEAEFAFNAIAPHWPKDLEFPAAVEVQLSSDGVNWTDPVVVGPAHTDAGPDDRDGRIFGELLTIEDATFVRYRPLDADGRVSGIPGLTFTYIDAKAGPRISDVARSTRNLSTARPPIISRREWGAEMAYGGVDRGTIRWTPWYQPVRHVIIHHSETPRFRDPLVEIRSIHYYHTVTRGWGDIGYNYLVDFMGNVYEGRAGGENVVGGHAFQYAIGSAGICCMGSFTVQHSTPEAIAGLTWITAWAARNLDPLGRRDFHEKPNLPTICAHRDVVNSTCPGDGLYADLPTIRTAVSDVLRGARQVVQDPAFSPGQTVQATAEGANMRRLPGASEQVAATIPFGTIMHVVEGPTTVGGYTWYKVTGNRGTGWMATSVFAASNAAPPTGKFTVDSEVEVDADMLNIRSEPSLRGSLIATIPLGTRGTVIEGPRPTGGYRWYRLQTAHGRGWAVEQYLVRPGQGKPRTRFVTGDTVAVGDRDGLRMRTAPGASSSLVRSLPYGTRGVVIGAARVSEGLTWLEVQTALGSGWVAERYLSSAPSGPVGNAKFAPGATVRVDTDSVNLRQAAGTDKAVIRALGNGVTGTVVDASVSANNMWWARIESRFGTGWVAEAFLASGSGSNQSSGQSSSRTFAVGDTIVIDTDGINLRAEPGTSSRVLTVMYQRESARVVGGPRTSDGYVWYQLQSRNHTGWGVSQYLARTAADPAGTSTFAVGDLVAIDTDGIRLRESAGLSGRWLDTIFRDEQAVVIGSPLSVDGYQWAKLRYGSREGWGAATYLKRLGKASITPGITARVIEGELNMRSNPGTGNPVVAVLPDGARVEVLEGPRSASGYEWVRVRSTAYGAGWCVTRYLVRG